MDLPRSHSSGVVELDKSQCESPPQVPDTMLFFFLNNLGEEVVADLDLKLKENMFQDEILGQASRISRN